MQVPVETLPANAPVNHQAALPARAAGPPDHQAGQGHQHYGHGTNAIDDLPGTASKEIIMDFNQACHEQHTQGPGTAYIDTDVGIEMTHDSPVAFGEADFSGVTGVVVSGQARDPITGVRSYGSVLQGIIV